MNVPRKLLSYTSKMEGRDEAQRSALETMHTHHPWYGKRRIGWALGWSSEKSRRLMCKFGIQAVIKKARRWKKSDDVGQPDAGIPNKTREIQADMPDKIWRTDFTFLVWRGTTFYLATVLDAYSRTIVGYTISLIHTKEFVLGAVKDALSKTGTKPNILHSDQGSEYRSFLVLDFLKQQGIEPSMSSKGSPWQNGQQESYYGKFKLEIGNLSHYPTFEEAIEAVYHNIHYHNKERIHTALKMAPMTYRNNYYLNNPEIKENYTLKE